MHESVAVSVLARFEEVLERSFLRIEIFWGRAYYLIEHIRKGTKEFEVSYD